MYKICNVGNMNIETLLLLPSTCILSPVHNLCNNTNPVKVGCIGASGPGNGNGVCAGGAESRELDSIALADIDIPVVAAEWEADGLGGSAVDTDGCNALVGAAHVVDLAVDVVKEHCLRGLRSADVG